MKTKMKRQGATELPRFIVGALATAGGSTANGATVQISFVNNVVSSATGITDFEPDLTGGLVDPLLEGDFGPGGATIGTTGNRVLGRAYAAANPIANALTLDFFSGVGYMVKSNPLSLRGLVAVSFSDLRINDGAASSGWLDMTAYAFQSLYTVQIHRLIFDDESTAAPINVAFSDGDYPAWQVSAVPEPGSNLALLALGAGGLTLRRRLKRAA